jgi:hypothetical protein
MIDADAITELDRLEGSRFRNSNACVCQGLRRQRHSVDEALVVAPVEGRVEIDLPFARSVEKKTEASGDRAVARKHLDARCHFAQRFRIARIERKRGAPER